MLHQKTIRASWLFAGALLFSASAFAQDGRVEVAGFGGGIVFYGGVSNITTGLYVASGGIAAHPLVGGSAGVRVTDHLRIFGEFSLVPLASGSQSESGVSGSYSNRLYDFGGGVDYSFGSSKVVPYVLGAVGLGREVDSESLSAGGVSASANAGSNAAYFGVGAGVRIYAGDNWGFKPEIRYQLYTQSLAVYSSSAVFTLGLFYQFGR